MTVTDTSGTLDPGKSKDALDFISANSSHGVVINGLLIWIDIQNQTTPPAIWKAQMIELFTDDEILEAKTRLFNAVGGEATRIGIFENHPKKKSLHAEDLVTAMKRLWESGEKPLLLASSDMMRTTRIYNVEKENESNISDVLNRVKLLESSLNNIHEEQKKDLKDLSDKIGRQTLVNCQPAQAGRLPAQGVIGGGVQGGVSGEGAHGGVPSGQESVSFPPLPLNQRVKQIRKETLENNSQPNSPKRRRQESESGESFYSVNENPGSHGQWADVVSSNNTKVNQGNTQGKESWKKRLNILQGTSKQNDDCDSFAADVSLVAHGLAKDASDEKLKNYLVGKGLEVVECKLMTKFIAESRALSFKVTIKAKDLEKAKNPEIWPARVGVRMYKHFSTKPKRQDQLSFESQTRGRGEANPAPGREVSVKGVKPVEQAKEVGITLSNRYAPLTTADLQDFEF